MDSQSKNKGEREGSGQEDLNVAKIFSTVDFKKVPIAVVEDPDDADDEPNESK